MGGNGPHCPHPSKLCLYNLPSPSPSPSPPPSLHPSLFSSPSPSLPTPPLPPPPLPPPPPLLTILPPSLPPSSPPLTSCSPSPSSLLQPSFLLTRSHPLPHPHPLPLLTIQAGKELCHYPPLHLPLCSLPLATNSINLIHKQNAGGMALGEREEVPERPFRLPRNPTDYFCGSQLYEGEIQLLEDRIELAS